MHGVRIGSFIKLSMVSGYGNYVKAQQCVRKQPRHCVIAKRTVEPTQQHLTGRRVTKHIVAPSNNIPSYYYNNLSVMWCYVVLCCVLLCQRDGAWCAKLRFVGGGGGGDRVIRLSLYSLIQTCMYIPLFSILVFMSSCSIPSRPLSQCRLSNDFLSVTKRRVCTIRGFHCGKVFMFSRRHIYITIPPSTKFAFPI